MLLRHLCEAHSSPRRLDVDGSPDALSPARPTLPSPRPRQTFGEGASTEELYHFAVMPLVGYAFERNGRGTCIAYGQTGA